MSSRVVPSLTSSRITSHISRRPFGSSPVVGSSRNSTWGRPTRLAPRSSRRRMPPEYVFAVRCAASVSSNRSSTSSARRLASAAGRWYRRPTMTRFSWPVRFSSTAAFWPARPISWRSCSASSTTSMPSTVALPSSGCSRVVRMRTAVVFPAPLGPSSPSTVDGRTCRSMPRRASTLPNRFLIPSISMASVSTEPSRLHGPPDMASRASRVVAGRPASCLGLRAEPLGLQSPAHRAPARASRRAGARAVGQPCRFGRRGAEGRPPGSGAGIVRHWRRSEGNRRAPRERGRRPPGRSVGP